MKRILAYIYLPLIAFYLFMTVVFPIDPATMARRHLSLMQSREISLSVAIPMIIVWLLALYGSRLLYEHARDIKQSKDGLPLLQLARGVQLLAWYVPIRAVSKIYLNYLASMHPNWQAATDIVLTYLHLAIPLTAFVIISRAAYKLGLLAKAKSALRTIYGLSLVFIGLGVAFCYASFTVGSGLTTNWLITSQEHIALPVRVATVVIPYLFMWFIGLLAAYQINLYQRQVAGVLYRRSLHRLSTGLIMVILVSIGLQFVTAVAANIQTIPILAVLAIVYSLVLLLGSAFLVIAKGVRQFRRLEEA